MTGSAGPAVIPFPGEGDRRLPDASEAPDPTPDDRAWFEGMVREHTTAILKYFARRAPRSDMDDLAADVFATAWRRHDTIPRGAELPWLYRTAGFILANYRRKFTDLPVEELPEDGSRSADSNPETKVIAHDELRRALAGVSERDRRILLLDAWEGLSRSELADVLQISQAGADAALSRARRRLREAWAEQLPG